MMNKDHVATIAPGFQRTTSQRRRVLGAAKLDTVEGQAHVTRSSTISLPSPASRQTVLGNANKHFRSNSTSTSTVGPLDKDKKLEKEKDKARSDDGFHSDSDKSSNHSSASVRNISHPTGTSSVKKLDPPQRVRPRSSLGALSDAGKAEKLNLSTLTVTRKAEEARQRRKIADLEISIESLTKINAELDATNKKQMVEILELRKKLQMYVRTSRWGESGAAHVFSMIIRAVWSHERCRHEGFAPESSCSDEERSGPISESELLEMERENDVRWRKICRCMERLVSDAKAAVEYMPRIVGTRVLTETELDVEGINRRLVGDGKSGRPLRKASSDISVRPGRSSPHGNDNQLTAEKMSKPSTNVPKRRSTGTPSAVSDTKSAPPGRTRPSTPRTSRPSTPRPGTPRSGTGVSRPSTPKPSLTLEVSKEAHMSSPELDLRSSPLSTASRTPPTPFMNSPESGSPTRNPERVQAVIIAKQQKLASSPTVISSPRLSEPKGLGLLLAVPEQQASSVSTHVPNSRVIDSPQRSPSVTLLYELQDLLGYNDHNTTYATQKFRKSMPALSTGRVNLQATQAGSNGSDNATGELQPEQDGSKDSQRVLRRRSSPNFRTPYQSISKSVARAGSESKTEHSHPSTTNRGSWLASLGFLSSWRNHDV